MTDLGPMRELVIHPWSPLLRWFSGLSPAGVVNNMIDGISEIEKRIWGKSRLLNAPYPLVWHLVDTAAVTGVLWDRVLTVNQRTVITAGLGVTADHAKALAMFWAGLHDVGKATPGFQMGDDKAFKALSVDPHYAAHQDARSLRHDFAAQLALPELLKHLGYEDGAVGRRDGWSRYRVAQMLGGHHGRFRAAKSSERVLLGGGGWSEQRAALVARLHDVLGMPPPPEKVDGLAAVLLTGVIILADWLASQEHFLRQRQAVLPDVVTAETIRTVLAGLPRAVDELLVEAGLGLPILRQADFQDVFPYAPNPLQRSIIEELLPKVDGPGLLVVTAATGDGKTEAALVAARALAEVSGASGFFFALPTMATSDQMYQRVRRFAARIAGGPAAVTLLHSMSWLNADYAARATAGVAGSATVVSDDAAGTRLVAPHWLRGRKRGLLAPFAVGTIDQALLAALPTKHNALRLLGLSGKVFIVDEAHAYDEYMQKLLQCLLTWLGAAGCPVVLLSATLPSTFAARLMDAYRRGTGGPAVSQAVEYPGWAFVPAASDQEPVTISAQARAEVIVGRTIELRLDVRPVRHLDGPEVDPLDRRGVLRSVLAPLVDGGGSAAVVCNTVDEAQRTYEMVRRWAPDSVDVVLLHSRFPAWRREEITELVTGRLGKDGDRNRPLIVVATQVIEQSLDLDVDILVSDLAPMAQLLQRAGRCHRHQRGRPLWAHEPRMVVLEPHDEHGYRPPRSWGYIYAPYLLRATHLRLSGLDAITVPDDVQAHMEAIYVPGPIADPQLADEHVAYVAGGMAERQIAKLRQIPDAGNLLRLEQLSENETDELWAETRLGADSVRLICCYVEADGSQWLDPGRHRRLPDHGRLTTEEVRAVLRESVPVREGMLRGYEPPLSLPESWSANAWLSDLHVLWFPLGDAGPAPAEWDERRAWLDHNLGLVIR